MAQWFRPSLLCRFFFFALAFAPTAHAKVIWNDWYIIRQNGGTPIAYYSERVEELAATLKIQVNSWKKTPGGVDEEHLGATAENTIDLKPVLYNFQRKTNQGKPFSIDGTILAGGRIFSARVNDGKGGKPKNLKVEMLPKLFFTSFFPSWIGKHQKKINSVQPSSFQTILEDQIDNEVPTAKGHVMEVTQDDRAKKSGTRKLRVRFFGTDQFWWVRESGQMVRMEIPSTGQTVEISDEATAKKALQK